MKPLFESGMPIVAAVWSKYSREQDRIRQPISEHIRTHSHFPRRVGKKSWRQMGYNVCLFFPKENDTEKCSNKRSFAARFDVFRMTLTHNLGQPQDT